MPIVLNGGLLTYEAVMRELKRFPAVMIGRGAYKQPSSIRAFLQGAESCALKPLDHVMMEYLDYVNSAQDKGHKLMCLLRPLQNVFYAKPNAKHWRIALSDCVQGKLGVAGLQAKVANDYACV